MPKYKVFVYPIVCVGIEEVEADTPEDACEKAEKMVNFDDLFDGLPISAPVTGVSYADDVDGYLVDFENDPEHELTTRYDHKCRPL